MTSSSVHNSLLKFRLLMLSLFVAAPSTTVAAPHPDHKNESHPPYQVNRAVTEPEIFAEGIISTIDDEMAARLAQMEQNSISPKSDHTQLHRVSE